VGSETTAPETPETPDQVDPDEAEENAPEGEVTSVEKDQVTPSGKSPEEVAEEAARVSASLIDEMGNRVQGIPPKEEVMSEAKDQVTPSGTDIALGLDTQNKVALTNSAVPTANDTLKARMAALNPEDRETFEQGIAKMAEQMLDKMERNQKAQEMTAAMVRGQDVYGNRARRANHDETLGGLSNGNVTLNRRARRQAERVLAESKAKK